MTKLRITTHSGDDDIVEVDNYSADELSTKINDRELHAIVIGNNVYSRIDLKNIKPIDEAE